MWRIRSAVVSSRVARGDDVATVAEDRRTVAQLEHLFEPVAHEQHGDAPIAESGGRS